MLTEEQKEIVKSFGTALEYQIFCIVWDYEQARSKCNFKYLGQSNISINKVIALRAITRCLGA